MPDKIYGFTKIDKQTNETTQNVYQELPLFMEFIKLILDDPQMVKITLESKTEIVSIETINVPTSDEILKNAYYYREKN